MKGLRREPRQGVVLSARQLTVLACVAKGLTPEQIAQRLGIQLSAVTDCMERTCARLRANDRPHAIALAIQHGHVTAPRSFADTQPSQSAAQMTPS
ncbi:response regulator transcription factor [Streptomyces sp. NPDC057273]